jgi:hypothetical protein
MITIIQIDIGYNYWPNNRFRYKHFKKDAVIDYDIIKNKYFRRNGICVLEFRQKS